MKQLAVVVGLCVFGLLAWLLGSRLSSDALGFAAGVVFGVLAGIPTALLVLASDRRQARRESGYDDDDTDDAPRTVNNFYVVTNNTDNRQLTINTRAQGMPLLADRAREIEAQREVRS